ncbi:MAG: AI-2E family transporter, partial [Bacteroidota bacterium]
MKPVINSPSRYIKVTCVLVSIFVVGYLVILGKEILSPLFFAALLAILLLPAATFFERKCKMKKSIAAIVTVLIFLVFAATLFYVLGGQGHALAREWPQFRLQLQSSLTQMQTWVSATLNIELDKQLVYINNASNKFLTNGTTMIGSTLVTLSAILFFVLFTCIYTVFFLRYRSLIRQFFTGIFHKRNMAMVRIIAEEVQSIIRQYILGLLIEMGTVSSVLCVIFSVVGIPYGILLGLLGGLLNLIPYLGIFITLIISVLITFAMAGISKVFLVVGILVITHLLDSNLLFPWIVGSKVRINPMAMIAGVVTGGMIWGVSGMFLSIPVMAIVKIICDRVEALKPWGVLLGSGEKASHRKKISVLI